LTLAPTGCDRPARDDGDVIGGSPGGDKADFALGAARTRANGHPGLNPSCSGGVARISVTEPYLGSTEVHIPTTASHCMGLGKDAIVMQNWTLTNTAGLTGKARI